MVREQLQCLVAQIVKNTPAMWEIWVRFLGWEDSWQMATHSRILAWRIPRLPVTSLQWLQDPHWVPKQAVVPSLIPAR